MQIIYISQFPVPNFHRDLGEILGRILAEIPKSRRPKSCRESRRDRGEIQKSRRPKSCRDLAEIPLENTLVQIDFYFSIHWNNYSKKENTELINVINSWR